jgi:putative membrane protein
MAGGFWTYEKIPLGVWLQEWFDTERNHYDRFGHFMQGFVPAIVFRELFLRCSPVGRGGWLVYFVLSSCLAFSALFELIEWWATLLYGGGADAFLGHQGDIWDAQWDMLWAVVGAAAALLCLSRQHDRSMDRLLQMRYPSGAQP